MSKTISKNSRRKSPSRFARQVAHAGFSWALAGVFAFGVYRVYKWAEPSAQSLAAVLTPSSGSSVNLELEDADFENFAGGAKNWSLKAGRILLERNAGSGAANLQSADIEDIREGRLFAAPEGTKAGEHAAPAARAASLYASSLHAPSSVMARPGLDAATTQSSADASAGLVTATFSAQHGHYVIGATEGLPSELLLAYAVQWQFRLTGNVKIRTHEGYQLNAPSILILELFNRHTAKVERQMLCEQGAQVRAKGADLQANQARYNAASQTVECLGGVHGAMQKDSVQGERFYWSLKDNTLRCPDEVSGVWQDTHYTAQDVMIDVNRHSYTGKKMVMQLSKDVVSKMAMGSLGLVMATGALSQGQSLPQKPLGELRFGGTYDSQNDVTVGHAFTYVNGSRVITGDNVRYNAGKNKKVLDADGHLVMDDPQNHVTGQKAHVEELIGLATITGDVVMVAKPDNSAPATGNQGAADIGGAKRQGAIITCDQVDSYYKRRFTYLRGHLAFKQRILRPGQPPLERTGTAEHAEYDQKKEILTLFPPVDGHDSDNNDFHQTENNVILGTHPGGEYIHGAKGTVHFTVEENIGEDENAPPPAAPPFVGDTSKPADAKPGDQTPATKPIAPAKKP